MSNIIDLRIHSEYQWKFECLSNFIPVVLIYINSIKYNFDNLQSNKHACTKLQSVKSHSTESNVDTKRRNREVRRLVLMVYQYYSFKTLIKQIICTPKISKCLQKLAMQERLHLNVFKRCSTFKCDLSKRTYVKKIWKRYLCIHSFLFVCTLFVTPYTSYL